MKERLFQILFISHGIGAMIAKTPLVNGGGIALLCVCVLAGVVEEETRPP